jgi:hypothetical protein
MHHEDVSSDLQGRESKAALAIGDRNIAEAGFGLAGHHLRVNQDGAAGVGDLSADTGEIDTFLSADFLIAGGRDYQAQT